MALACLAAGVFLGWSAGIGWAAGLLGVEFVIGLAPGTAPAGGWTLLVAAALLLMTELAYWSLELRTPIRDEPNVHRRRAAALGALATGGGILGAAPLLADAAPFAGGPLLMVLGALAAVGVLVLLVALARQARLTHS